MAKWKALFVYQRFSTTFLIRELPVKEVTADQGTLPYYLRESIDRLRLKRGGMLKEERIKEEIHHDGDDT